MVDDLLDVIAKAVFERLGKLAQFELSDIKTHSGGSYRRIELCSLFCGLSGSFHHWSIQFQYGWGCLAGDVMYQVVHYVSMPQDGDGERLGRSTRLTNAVNAVNSLTRFMHISDPECFQEFWGALQLFFKACQCSVDIGEWV